MSRSPQRYAGIEELAKVTGLKMSEVKQVFSAVVLLSRKFEEVRIRGFGRFRARHFKGRTVHLNNQPIFLQAHRVLHFNSSNQANKMLSAQMGIERGDD